MSPDYIMKLVQDYKNCNKPLDAGKLYDTIREHVEICYRQRKDAVDDLHAFARRTTNGS